MIILLIRSARRARYRSDRRHRRNSRRDIGAVTGPASSREGEASRCTRRQSTGKPHRRRPTVFDEAIQPATPVVGAADFRSIDDGPAGGELPKWFAVSREDTRFVTEFIDRMFPVSPEGVDFDASIQRGCQRLHPGVEASIMGRSLYHALAGRRRPRNGTLRGPVIARPQREHRYLPCGAAPTASRAQRSPPPPPTSSLRSIDTTRRRRG